MKTLILLTLLVSSNVLAVPRQKIDCLSTVSPGYSVISHGGEKITLSALYGEQVKNFDGQGIVTSITTPFNGLYYEPEKTEIVVWYGTGPGKSQNGWVSRKYDARAVSLANAKPKRIRGSADMKKLGKLYLNKVITPDGEGILVGIETPSNGLYFEPERTKVTVWYSTEKAQNGWVSRQYYAGDIRAATKL